MLVTLKSCSKVSEVQSRADWYGGMTQEHLSVELMKLTEMKDSTQFPPSRHFLKADLKEIPAKQASVHARM